MFLQLVSLDLRQFDNERLNFAVSPINLFVLNKKDKDKRSKMFTRYRQIKKPPFPIVSLII